MIITKIHIKKFGCLSGFEVLPSDKLNIIYAPNESGKSTLLDFIRYMFYGCDRRKKVNGLTFKDKYMPWNGFEMGGVIEFKHNDVSYCLERYDGLKSSEKICRLTDLTNGCEVMCSNEPGYEFFSFSEKIFCDTCFINDVRSVSENNKDGELMATVSGTGSDEVAYSKIRKNLSDMISGMSSLRRNKSDMKLLEDEIAVCKKHISALESDREKIELDLSREEEITKKKAEKEKLRQAYIDKNNINRIAYLEDAKKNDISAVKNLEMSIETLSGATFSGHEKYEAGNNKSKTKQIVSLSVSFMSLLSLITAVIIKAGIFSVMICAFVFLMCVLYLIFCKQKKSAGFNFESSETDDKKLETLKNSVKNLKKKIEYADLEIESIKKEINHSIEISENFVETNSFTNEKINDIIYELDGQIRDFSIELTEFEREKEKLDNTKTDLGSAICEYEALCRKKKELESEIKVYEYAICILDRAFDKMKNGISPVLNEKVQEIFSVVTQGKYENIISDEKFRTLVSVDDSFKSSAYLSAGTGDVLDFSIRMAIVDIMSVSCGSLPLFMDDPFLRTDDKRCCKLMDYILKNSDVHQTFYAACTSREGLYYKDNTEVKIISL